MSRPTPRSPKPSQDREGDYLTEFRANLRRIAIRLARHSKSTIVDVTHVDEAFNVLCRIGISRQPWWKRPEFDTTIGGFFVATALAAPDMLPVVFDTDWLQENHVPGGVVAVSGILALLFFVKGWFKSFRPS